MWGDGDQVRQVGAQAADLADDVSRQADLLSRCRGVQWQSPAADGLRQALTEQERSLRLRAEDLTGASRLLGLHARAVDDRIASLARLESLDGLA